MTPQSPLELAPANILVVEERPDTRSLVRVALECAGYQVAEVGNLADARAALRQGPPNVVVCGTQFGVGGSGLDLLQELAPASPDIAVVMLAGNNDFQTAIDCLRGGAFDCLPDGFQVEELREVITRTLQRQQRLVAERRRLADPIGILSRFVSENPNPIFHVANNGIVLYANPACQRVFDELNCQVGAVVPRALERIIADVAGKGSGEGEVELGTRTFAFLASPIQDTGFCYIYGHEITRFKEAERKLTRLLEEAQAMALRDPLTGLPNRTLLQDRLGQAIAQCARSSKKLGLAFIDLDNFKLINDAHGHQAGDQILVEVARQISAIVRKTDTVARWGGDELLLLLPGLNTGSEARAVVERIKHLVEKALAHNPQTRLLTLSMGVAIYPDHASGPEVLLQQADKALHRAKAGGRNRVVLFGEWADVPR